MKEKLILELFKKKCIKFGDFSLKDGSKSPIYIDLKNIISYPFIFNILLDEIINILKSLEFDRLLGIPYGGLVIASSLCTKFNKPMILMRKEVKKYGLKKSIEGEYNENDKCLIIEDTITTGSSALQFINNIKKYKLVVNDIIVICDRRIDNKYNFNGRNIHSIFTITDIINILYRHNFIDLSIYNNIKSNIVKIKYKSYNPDYNNKILKRLLDIIKKKGKNYCFKYDFNNLNDFNKLLEFIEYYKNDMCILKLYSDLISHFDYNKLKELSIKYNFLIMDGKLFNFSETIFFCEYTKTNMYKWVNLIELSGFHNNNIFEIVNEINKNVKCNVSVIYNNYNSNENDNDNLLYKLNKNKNIIGLNKSYLDCDILIFETLASKNSNANIIIIEKKDYYINNRFIPLSTILQ